MKKGIAIMKAFQKILDECTLKPNKVWVKRENEFYNRTIKSWLQENDIKIYPILKEGKPVVAERFFVTLKNKVFEYLTSISQKVYNDKLADIMNEYNSTFHRPLKRSLLM